MVRITFSKNDEALYIKRAKELGYDVTPSNFKNFTKLAQTTIDYLKIFEDNLKTIGTKIKPKSTKVTKEEIEKLFYHHAKRVWGENINKIQFTFSIVPGKKEMMSVAYKSRPKAIGSTLVSTPKVQNVYISDKLFNLPPEHIEQIVIHEVIHIGYSRHDEDFRRVVEKYGGTITTSQLEGYGYHVQAKPRADKRCRFKDVKVFDNLMEAEGFANVYHSENRDMRVRVQY